MSRIAILFALFFCATLALAVPLQQGNATSVELDKRITHVGRGTWFEVGWGNCGYHDVNSSPIVAISKARYDANGGANCNQWIQITNTANGKVAYGKTRDSCESCDTSSLDMSPSLFQKLSTLNTGEIKISWHFMSASWSP
ncbi:RlpA-like double-psi beta-barrel-protein domain-containing protein-containing protein [Mycena sp. CBHHK59/15]|nr:RlpA-like double-psi beta-barrel-protein domain-containing protein-containing protein [Mycena sp. CBHHK59/15]